MSKRGFELKLGRAYQHLLDANSATSQFLAREPYDIGRDEQSEPGKLLFWITLLEEPPADIALIAGDAVHNMRSVLDHLVYEISARREASPRDTGFPLFTHQADWDKRNKDGTLQVRSGLNQVRLLPDEAITIIRNMQPWSRPVPFAPDAFGPSRETLRELHALDIADKHKNLNLAVLNVDVVGIGTERPSEGFTFEHLHRSPLQLNARTPLLRVAYPIQMNVEPLSKLDVIFSEGPTAGEPVEGKLEAFFRSVGIVLDHLRPFI
jgi:hypothetical protein